MIFYRMIHVCRVDRGVTNGNVVVVDDDDSDDGEGDDDGVLG